MFWAPGRKDRRENVAPSDKPWVALRLVAVRYVSIMLQPQDTLRIDLLNKSMDIIKDNYPILIFWSILHMAPLET